MADTSFLMQKHIQYLIETENINELDKIDNLQPSCPINGYSELDPILYLILSIKLQENLQSKFNVLKYLVEKRNLDSNIALEKCLEKGFFDIARYLYKKGFFLDKKQNYVYSLECMKLVHDEWKRGFSKKAVFEICCVWNDSSTSDRLNYLFGLKLWKYYVQDLLTLCTCGDHVKYLILNCCDLFDRNMRGSNMKSKRKLVIRWLIEGKQFTLLIWYLSFLKLRLDIDHIEMLKNGRKSFLFDQEIKQLLRYCNREEMIPDIIQCDNPLISKNDDKISDFEYIHNNLQSQYFGSYVYYWTSPCIVETSIMESVKENPDAILIF